MRLPEDKSSRQKVLALIALGAVGAAYGLWMGVCDPLRRGRDEAKARSAALEEELEGSRAQIARIGEMQRSLEEVVRALHATSERDMLHPQLGNYILQARELLTQPGIDVGATDIKVTEIGLVDPPSPPKAAKAAVVEGASGAPASAPAAAAKVEKPFAVKAYSARVTAECGTGAFLEWVRALEAANPLMAISQFTIAAQVENPQRHQVRFEVQWPVWVDPETREVVQQKAAEVLGEEAK